MLLFDYIISLFVYNKMITNIEMFKSFHQTLLQESCKGSKKSKKKHILHELATPSDQKVTLGDQRGHLKQV